MDDRSSDPAPGTEWTTPSWPDEKRLSRNLNELLQEFRVAQTGVQILTGFLLTVPFSARFSALSEHQVDAYLAVLVGATASTGFLLAPVACHRLLFRHRQRAWLVEVANRCALLGLLLALTSSGVLYLIFDVIIGGAAAVTVLGCGIVFFATLWAFFPLSRRRHSGIDGSRNA